MVGQETTLDVPDIVSEIFQVQTSCKIEPIFSQPVTYNAVLACINIQLLFILFLAEAVVIAI